jgi:hypothetical protein
MRSSSHGKAPQQSFEPDLSQKSSNISTSLKTGLQTPPLLSERSSSLQDVQIFPLTSGSTLSKDMRSTLPKSLVHTIPLMSRLSSPKMLETSSSSPFESLNSPKPSPAMGTGLPRSERPSKQSHMPCQDNTLSMPPIKCICQGFLRPSLPHSTLGSSTLIRPSDIEQPIRNNFASLSLPCSTTSEPFSSPHLVWVQVPEKETKGPPSVEQDLPFLEAESPATTGIEAPIVTQHLKAHTRMSVITVGAEELTDDQTIQSQSLNQGLSRGQKFRRHFVWDPAAAVRSRTVRWTELAGPLPSPPPSEFNNVEALDTIQTHSHLFAITTPINVDVFKSLLSSHPNQPFVQSVCLGLRQGFWPFANGGCSAAEERLIHSRTRLLCLSFPLEWDGTPLTQPRLNKPQCCPRV